MVTCNMNDDFTSDHPNWYTIWIHLGFWPCNTKSRVMTSLIFCHYNPTFAITSRYCLDQFGCDHTVTLNMWSLRVSDEQVIFKPFIIVYITPIKSYTLHLRTIQINDDQCSTILSSNLDIWAAKPFSIWLGIIGNPIVKNILRGIPIELQTINL